MQFNRPFAFMSGYSSRSGSAGTRPCHLSHTSLRASFPPPSRLSTARTRGWQDADGAACACLTHVQDGAVCEGSHTANDENRDPFGERRPHVLQCVVEPLSSATSP